MKINFFNSHTQQKISILFLLVLTYAWKTQTGETFEECIKVYDNSSYNSLVKFPFSSNSKINNGLQLTLCCGNDQCSPITEGANCPAKPWNFSCRKVSETTFCTVYTGIFCGGIVGNTPITTNTTIRDCPNLNQFAIKALENSTYHGNKDVYCQEINPCPMQYKRLSCYWDNGGWTCDETFINSCLLQWTNSSVISSTSSHSTTPTVGTVTVSPSILPPSKPHLAEKIAIPVGTTVGVATIGGVTYYLIQKKRKNKRLGKNQSSTGQLIDSTNTGIPTKQPQLSGLGIPIISGLGMVTFPNEENEQTIEELPAENIELQEFQTQIPPK